MGLAPLFVEKIFEIIKTVNDEGISVFVVEQNANVALSIADRGYVLQTGEVVLSGPAQELLHNEAMKKAYLGDV
jgi:branched-chain amino acid transport system ATP-binding protein